MKVENTTAGAVTQEAPKQTATEAKAEAKTEPTLVEKMFGSKVKLTKKPEETKDDTKSDNPDSSNTSNPVDSKIEQGDKDGADNLDNNTQNPNQPASQTHKKTAKERVQESRREVKKYREESEAKAREIERLTTELQRFQSMKEEDKTPKDQYREVYAEERMREIHNQIHNELNDYVTNHENPQMFQTNYEYYIPILNKNDPWTVQQFHKFPEKLKMYDLFFQAMTGGVFSPQDWINAPQPLKLQKLIDLQKMASGESNNATAPASESKKEEPQKKVVEDSVVPDLKKGGTSETINKSQESVFKKVFEKGRTK